MNEKTAFNCGHPNVQANRAKLGQGRIGCRTCRNAWRRANPDKHNVKGKRQPVETPEDEPVVVTPGRLALRRFSWEDDPTDGPWSGSKR